MRKVVIVVLVILFEAFSLSGSIAGKTPEEIMEAAFSNYKAASNEKEISEVTTTSWDKNKICTTWVKREGEGDKIMLVLNRNEKMAEKPDGLIINSFSGVIKSPVSLQTRRKIKVKSSGFNQEVHGTELNYYDLARLTGENVQNLILSSWKGKPDSRIHTANTFYSIKVENKRKMEGDYVFRVFYVGEYEEMAVIVGMECFNNQSQKAKIIINSDFERIDLGTLSIVRENERHIITTKGETIIKVIAREFNGFGNLNEEALKRGSP